MPDKGPEEARSDGGRDASFIENYSCKYIFGDNPIPGDNPDS
jgi:hypothetical protein